MAVQLNQKSLGFDQQPVVGGLVLSRVFCLAAGQM